MNNYLKISILAIVIIGIAIHESKSEYFYNEMGEFKQFGLKNDETILPLWLALTIIGIFVYNFQILNEGKYII